MSQIFPNSTALRNQFPTMDLTPTLTPMHKYGKSEQGNAYMEMYTGHTFVKESSLRIQTGKGFQFDARSIEK